MHKRRIALIPAYEPDEVLLSLLDELVRTGFEIIVVDDGSSSRCNDIFEKVQKYGVLLRNEKNLGKGAALKKGLSYIRDSVHENAVAVTLDADGQHTAADALKVCIEAENNPKTLILGSRQLNGNTPFRSRIGNSVTRWIYRISTGVKVYDTQTGLRAFDTELLPELCGVQGERYEYEMNVLLDFARKHIPIKEVGIETIYINNNAASHFNTLYDSARIYKQILKFSASSLTAFAVDYLAYMLISLVTSSLGSTASLVVSNITARLISGSVNFSLNRKFVFKDKSNIFQAAVKYILLAAVILIGNTLVLNLLVTELEFNRYISKLLTEMLFFVLSFLTQRFLVFKKEKNNE